MGSAAAGGELGRRCRQSRPCGIGWIVAFTHFLRTIDELQRKIMQDALAVTLGVGWILGFAYVVTDDASLVARDVDIAVLPALMGVVFVVAFVVGKIRYR